MAATYTPSPDEAADFQASRMKRHRAVSIRLGFGVAAMPLVMLAGHWLLEPTWVRSTLEPRLLTLGLLLLHPFGLLLRLPDRVLPYLLYGGLLSVETILLRLLGGGAEAALANLPAFQFFILFPPMLGVAYGFRANALGCILLTLLPAAAFAGGLIPGFPLVRFAVFATPSLLLSLYTSYLTQGLTLQLFRDRKEIESLALRDPLTGLLNRRSFLPLSDGALKLAQRNLSPLVALVMDLDAFKAVNDRHGHAIGDEVIRCAAGALAETLRTSDMVARMGGEEFAALLPDTGPEEARVAAERLRKAIEALRIPLPDGSPGSLRVTASIGLAMWNGGEETLHQLLVRADRALYAAKQNGRNRVEMAPEEEG